MVASSWLMRVAQRARRVPPLRAYDPLAARAGP